MYLCFIDESGSPPKKSAKDPKPYFCIAAVIMHEAQWHDIAKELDALKALAEFRIVGEVKWRFFGKDNKDPINSVGHLNHSDRMNFRRRFFEIVTRRKSVKIVVCVTDVRSAYQNGYIANENDLYFYTYKQISERFQYFLQDMSRQVGQKQLGIIVADHRGRKQDELLRSGHHNLIDRDSPHSASYDNYVETIFLTPSHLSVGIQFADMAAGAVGRSFNSGDQTYMDLIKPSLRKSPTGKVEGYGLIKFPKNT